jgi:cobalamin biosynthesis protein CobT
VKSSAAPENGLDGTNFEFDIKGFAGTAHVTAAMFRLPPEEPVEEKPANKPAAGNSGMRPFQDNTAAANTEKKEDSEADKKDEESNAADESADKEGDASESDEAKASDAAEPQAEEKQEYVIAESEKKDKLPMPTWAAKAIQVTFPNGEVYDLTIKAIEKRASMAR